MMPSYQVTLLANYPRDGQQSMDRFSELLRRELAAIGIPVKVLRPTPIFGRFAGNTLEGVGKWLAYLDKYVLFPVQLICRRREPAPTGQPEILHIVDHSNSVYRFFVRSETCVCTCHDVLAIRGALGEDAVCCPASRAGRLLQGLILKGLKATRWIGCVSDATRHDLEQLTERSGDPGIRTILLGLNAAFRIMPVSEARGALEAEGPWVGERFLLHVGSGLPRKNRRAVVEVLDRLGSQWKGHAVFAGEDLSGAMKGRIRELGLERRVHCVVRPTHEQLNALYCLAEALIFPSYAEGFGWPVLEAQASGCPVICSNRTSVPEVAGTGAVVCDPDDFDGMARAVLELGDSERRQTLVKNGVLNLRRFDNAALVQGYTRLYASALAGAAG